MRLCALATWSTSLSYSTIQRIAMGIGNTKPPRSAVFTSTMTFRPLISYPLEWRLWGTTVAEHSSRTKAHSNLIRPSSIDRPCRPLAKHLSSNSARAPARAKECTCKLHVHQFRLYRCTCTCIYCTGGLSSSRSPPILFTLILAIGLQGTCGMHQQRWSDSPSARLDGLGYNYFIIVPCACARMIAAHYCILYHYYFWHTE